MADYWWVVRLALVGCAFLVFFVWAIVFGPPWLLGFAALAAAGFIVIAARGGASESGGESGTEASGPGH